jgi:hypothetical protein
MFATIRRHQKWLWFVVIVGVILPFVWFMGPTSYQSGGGLGRRQGNYGSLNGRPIDRETFNQAYQEARIGFYLSTQVWPEQNERARLMFNPERQVAERLLLIDKLRELKVHVTDASVADWIAQNFRDTQRNVFNPELYRQFVERSLRRGNVSAKEFEGFIRHDIGRQHLFALGSLSGSVMPPREAELQLRREQELVTAQIALLSSSNYLAEVVITPDALSGFYTNQASRYNVPEKVRVAYASFSFSNYAAQADAQLTAVTNLDTQLEALYRQRGPETFTDTNGQPMSAAAAKQTIKATEVTRLSEQFARRKALEFAEQLYALYEEAPHDLSLLERVAASNQIPASVTEPFTRFARPAGLLVGAEFGQAAFALSTNQPLATEPVIGQTAIYILAFKERIPTYLPPLDDNNRPTVTADYRQTEARKRAREAADRFHASLTNLLAQGVPFESACASNNLTPLRPPAFSRATESLPSLSDRVDFTQLKSVALDLPTGGTSSVEETRDGAMVVHVVARQPVDEARIKTELPAFMTKIRDDHRQEALMEWFRKEMDTAQISFPENLLGSRRSRAR